MPYSFVPVRTPALPRSEAYSRELVANNGAAVMEKRRWAERYQWHVPLVASLRSTWPEPVGRVARVAHVARAACRWRLHHRHTRQSPFLPRTSRLVESLRRVKQRFCGQSARMHKQVANWFDVIVAHPFNAFSIDLIRAPCANNFAPWLRTVLIAIQPWD